MHVIVMAKAPVPGRVKTRLAPEYTFDEAAALAEAALADTLDAALASATDRVVVALDGEPGPWLPPGCELVAQRGRGLDERLAAAWTHVGGPGVQIGMDTPQVTAAHLDAAFASLDGHPAALGLSTDGGWWAIALHRPDPRAFLGVPMSREDTGVRQLARLRSLGLDVAALPVLRDVDRAPDVPVVSSLAPNGRFARLAASMAVLDAR